MDLYGGMEANKCASVVNILRLLQLLVKVVLWWAIGIFGVQRITTTWQILMTIIGGLCFLLYEFWRLWKAWKLKHLFSYQWVNTLYDIVVISMIKAMYFDTIRVQEGVTNWLLVMEIIVSYGYLVYIIIPFILICYVFQRLCKASRDSYSTNSSHRSLRHKPGWVLVLQGVHYFLTVIMILINVTFNIGTLTYNYKSLSLFDLILFSNLCDLCDVFLNLIEDCVIRQLRINDHPYFMYSQMKESLLQTGL